MPTARVNARLLLLKLDEQAQWMFHRGDLQLTMSPVLLKVADPHRQRQIATRAARPQLTIPEIERIVDRGLGALQVPPPPSSLPPDEPEKEGLSPSRVAALDNLSRHAEASLSFGDLANLFRDTCCARGGQTPGAATHEARRHALE